MYHKSPKFQKGMNAQQVYGVPILPLFMAYSEQRCDFVEGFVFGLRDLPISETPEYSQEHAEWQEGVVFQRCLHGGEADGDEEVGTPVDQDGDGHGGRPWALAEQLGRNHPRN